MGQSSQAGQIGFGIQSVKGTAVAATRFARIRGGSLGGDRSLLTPDPEIGGTRDHQGAYLGPVSFSGDIDFYPRAQMIAMLLFGALGARASTNVAGPPLIGTHVITGGNTLPWLSVEERLGDSMESFRYTDVRVNTLRLEAEAAGYVMGSAGLIGLKGESGFTAQATPAVDNTPLMVGTSVTFNLDGADLKARSWSIEINNNIENDDFRLGSVYLGDAVPKRREIRMTAGFRPDDATLWKKAMWGSSSATEAQSGAAYRGPAQAVIETFETIGNVVSGTPYSITVDLGDVIIEPFKITPQGDDVIGADISMLAVRPSNANPICTATVVNDLAQVA